MGLVFLCLVSSPPPTVLRFSLVFFLLWPAASTGSRRRVHKSLSLRVSTAMWCQASFVAHIAGSRYINRWPNNSSAISVALIRWSGPTQTTTTTKRRLVSTKAIFAKTTSPHCTRREIEVWSHFHADKWGHNAHIRWPPTRLPPEMKRGQFRRVHCLMWKVLQKNTYIYIYSTMLVSRAGFPVIPYLSRIRLSIDGEATAETRRRRWWLTLFVRFAI